METVKVVDQSRIGRKGFPMHSSAFPEIALPTKEVPISDINDSTEIVNPEELTIDQKRALMPVKTPREFRDILIDEGVLTDAVPDEVTLAIQKIPFDKERTKALNAWHNMTEARRSDPYIDMIGAMFGYTPEQIDELWTN